MSANVYATYGTSQASATLIVAPPVLTNLTVSPSTVVGGNAVTAEVTLNAPAGAEGAGVSMASSHPELVSTPVKIVVPSGQTSASAALTTAAVAETTQVVVSATRYGVTKSATVTLEPASRIQALGKSAAGVTTGTEGRTIVRVPASDTTRSGAEGKGAAAAQPVALCASLALPPCLTATALDVVTLETQDPVDPTERRYYLYTPELNLLAETPSSTATVPPIAYEYIWFAGEPLAQVNIATGEIHYYFTDHLGTPILQTDESARVVWQAEYDPYGGIHAIRRGEGKHQPLRLPGQEADGATETAYNVYRWYRSSWGRYSQADPIALQGGFNLFAYALDNPINYDDPLGLRVRMCCRIIPFTVLVGNALRMMPPGASFPPQRHCFFQFDNSTNDDPLGLHGTQTMGGYVRAWFGRDRGTVLTDADFDRGRRTSDVCGPWAQDPCNDVDQCVRNAGSDYPSPSQYSLLGPNSNTFAFTVARQCYVRPPHPVNAPGWNAAPPQP